ncbi:MAG: LptA/OstA family protein [Parvularculaceae bacterium]|nr:LptA/OstA family protein [Parvularculaceae bacterium]
MTKAGAFLRSVAAGLAAAAMIGGHAGAQLATIDSDAPVDITGDRLEVEDKVATFIGNVRAVQGPAILTAERLVADLDDKGSFTKIRATGTVRYSNGKEAITGAVAVFDDIARTITISENVVVTQGEQVMTGGNLVYWVDTGKILFTASSGKRIRGIFYAKDQPGQS